MKHASDTVYTINRRDCLYWYNAFCPDPACTAQTLSPWASKHPSEWRIKDGIILQLGKLALTSNICAKAPSEGSSTARDRMQVKITAMNVYLCKKKFFLTSSPRYLDILHKTTLKSPVILFVPRAEGRYTWHTVAKAFRACD